MRYVKTIFILVLIVTLFSTCCFAEVDNCIEQECSQDYVLETCNQIGNITILSNNTSSLTFTVDYGNGLSETISKTFQRDGSIKYTITNGDIINEMVICTDGALMVDGAYVKELCGNTLKNIYVNGNEPTRLARYEIVNTCPYGSPSDYTVGGPGGHTNVLERAFKDITVAVYSSVIKATLNLANVGTNTWDGIVDSFDWYVHNVPNRYSFYYEDDRRVHNVYGFTIYNGLSVAKHSTTYYKGANSNSGAINSSPYVWYERFTY